MAAPLFKRGDIVYLEESAEIGRLEAYEISESKQSTPTQWLYKIRIHQRPPIRPTIGDQFRPQAIEPDLWYTASEFMTYCETLSVIVIRLQTQQNRVDNYLSSICATQDETQAEGAPKFNLEDEIWLSASAKLGFFENRLVNGVFEVGVQPGSKKTRYRYSLLNISQQLYFREDELLTKCEAATFVHSAITNQLTGMTQLQNNADC